MPRKAAALACSSLAPRKTAVTPVWGGFSSSQRTDLDKLIACDDAGRRVRSYVNNSLAINSLDTAYRWLSNSRDEAA